MKNDAATIPVPRGRVVTTARANRVRHITPSLWEPSDTAVTLDYAVWIAGEDAHMYTIAAPPVPAFAATDVDHVGAE